MRTLAVAAGLLGAAAAASGAAGGAFLAATDLATGWALLAVAVACERDGAARTAWLLLATGAAWFLGTIADAAGAAAPLLFVHRPLLVLAVLSVGARSRLRVAAVAAAAATVLPAATAAGWPLLLAATASLAIGASRRSIRGAALFAAAAFASAGALTLTAPSAGLAETGLVFYELCIAGAGVAVGRRAMNQAGQGLADRVVELGDRGSLAAALAEVLDDPSVEVLPPDARVGTPVLRDGQVIAVLACRPETLRDPRVADAASSAVRLALDNRELVDRLASGLDEIRASTRRLEVAGERAGRGLEQRIRSGPERRLEKAERLVDGDLAARLRAARAELRDLASGLHPRALADDGLHGALDELVKRSAVRVEWEAPRDRFPPEVELAAFFICSEGLANVAKYAGASRAQVLLRAQDGALHVHVGDDGAGGAQPSAGSGLQGLRDRALGLGGNLDIVSAPGRGTVLAAELPLEPAA